MIVSSRQAGASAYRRNGILRYAHCDLWDIRFERGQESNTRTGCCSEAGDPGVCCLPAFLDAFLPIGSFTEVEEGIDFLLQAV